MPLAYAGNVSAVAAGMSDFTIRASGLAKLTRQSKHIFGLELNSLFQSVRHLEFENLPEKILNGFKVHAVTKADWNQMRPHTFLEEGVEYLDPLKMPKKTGVKFVAMINAEARKAVPEPGAEVAAIMTGGAAPGTLGRESRSAYG